MCIIKWMIFTVGDTLFSMRARKRKLTRTQRRRRQQHWTMAVVGGLVGLCICGIFLMSVANRETAGSRYTYTTTSDIWYVDSEGLEVAAAAAEPAATPAPEAAQGAEEAPQGGAAAEDAGTAKPMRGVAPPTPDPTRPPATITITATGDCTLGSYKTGSGKTSNFKSFVEKYGYDYFLQNVRDLFAQDDLTIVNLEGPLTSHSTKRPGRTFNFRGYPDYVSILSGSSVEICNLANNHALDYNKDGFKDTYEALTAAGIGASGYGPEYYVEVNGYVVGSLGFTEWNFDAKDILASVEAAAKKCDLLIVSMHWGKERHYELSSYSRRMGRALIDAGADLVIGNHSHVYGEIEKYNGKYIINSLGNFCFGGNDDPDIMDCAIFRQKFIMTDDGNAGDGGIDIIPALISSHEDYNDFQPRIADAEDGARMLAEIKRYSPTLTAENVLWLDDSYVYRCGLLDAGAQSAESASPEALEGASAVPTPEMEIAQDIAR